MTQWNNTECRRRRWTRELITAAIVKLSTEPVELTPKQVQLNCPSLYGAALRHFGSWKGAVEAAGVNYNEILMRHRPGFWSRETVAAEIRMLAERNSASARKLRKDLYCAALRIFGSWEAAVREAGFDYATIHQGWAPVDSQGLRFARRKR